MGRVVGGIDSGRDTGWGVTDEGALTDCGLVVIQDDRPLAGCPTIIGAVVWIEVPIYRQGNNQVDPQNLIAQSDKAGRVREHYLARGNRVETVFPSTWKGSLTKEIHHPRIREELTPEEIRIVERCLLWVAESKRHNVWDAVGLAIWAARREGIRK